MEHATDLPPIRAKVELLPGCEQVYRNAVAGSRGVIRDHSIDDDGFPLVYVEWDREHWRYNEEPDGWTFGSHFKVIGMEPEKEEPEPSPSLALEPITTEATKRAEQFLQVLYEAFEDTIESDGFFIITLKEDKEFGEGYVAIRPRWFSASLTDDAQQLLEEQLPYLVEIARARLKGER